MLSKALFSSDSFEWATPDYLFNDLDKEFHFTLDPCSSDSNFKCVKHYTISDNGLLKDWCGERVFCNPPYGRTISSWVKKCYLESLKPYTLVVMLLPVRTDTSWFHDFIYNKARDIRFIRGRLHFNNSVNSAPFPSMIVIF